MRVFQWKQLENLYFRDKKFSIEVHDAKRVVQTVSTFNLYEDALKLDKHSDTSEASTLKETSGTAPGRVAFTIFERYRTCFYICISLVSPYISVEKLNNSFEQVWSLTQFYSVDLSQSKDWFKKVRFSTNAQSGFASVVVDGVLGTPRLARHT